MSVHELPGAAISRRLSADKSTRSAEPPDDVLAEPPDEPLPDDDAGMDEPKKAAEPKSGPSQATRLVQLATKHYELGVTPAGEPYAIPASGPKLVRVLRGGQGSLRAELARRYYRAAGATPSQSALADACTVLDGMAQQADPVALHLRVAEHDGWLVLDLGDPTGRAVVIGTDGWNLTAEPPVRFRRTALTGALPEPTQGGSLDTLWSAINVAARYRPILAAVLVAALMPNLPHPVVAITGEQGTGKSTATRRITSLIDPSSAQVRKVPRDAEAATTAAAGSWMPALDNVSDMPDWLSDCLCRWSTGEGDVRRRLYTDGELYVVAFRRAPVINGIDLGALRGDLADRLVHILLDLIAEDQRREDVDLDAKWNLAHPQVLGALLDLTVKVLRTLPDVQMKRSPRMADFARVLAAVDQVLGTKGLDTYRGLSDELAHDAVTSDPVLIALVAAITEEWTGTSAELLDRITDKARSTSGNPDKWRAPKDWPSKARSLTAVLRRQAPTLRRVGWTVIELPRDTTREKVLRWQLTPPVPRDGGNNAADAANAAPGGIVTGHSSTEGAANPAANPRRDCGVAAPTPQGAANAAPTLDDAAPFAAPDTPAVTSANGDHAANAATAAPNPYSLGQLCDVCGGSPAPVDAHGRRLCAGCDPRSHRARSSGKCTCQPPCPDGICLVDLEAS